MSPSWRDRIRIALTPDLVTAVRIPRALRAHVADKHCVPCEWTGDLPSWGSALASLRTLLGEFAETRADATIVLSDHFVRYVLVPWNDQLTRAEEEAAFARHCFEAVYGDIAQNWEVRVSEGAIGQPRVASAIDRQLLAALRELFQLSRVRLRSIQPHLMAAYNYWERSLDAGPCLFVLAEPRLYTCMSLVHNNCHAVRSGPVQRSLFEDLPLILDREQLWSAFEEPPRVFLYAPQEPEFRLPGDASSNGESLRLEAAPGFSPLTDRVYSMAACV